MCHGLCFDDIEITHVLTIAVMNVPSGNLHHLSSRRAGSLRMAELWQKRELLLPLDPPMHIISTSSK